MMTVCIRSHLYNSTSHIKQRKAGRWKPSRIFPPNVRGSFPPSPLGGRARQGIWAPPQRVENFRNTSFKRQLQDSPPEKCEFHFKWNTTKQETCCSRWLLFCMCARACFKLFHFCGFTSLTCCFLLILQKFQVKSMDWLMLVSTADYPIREQYTVAGVFTKKHQGLWTAGGSNEKFLFACFTGANETNPAGLYSVGTMVESDSKRLRHEDIRRGHVTTQEIQNYVETTWLPAELLLCRLEAAANQKGV